MTTFEILLCVATFAWLSLNIGRRIGRGTPLSPADGMVLMAILEAACWG